MPQITNPGGLWDETQNLYPRTGGMSHLGPREWRWRRGGKMKFARLQFDTTVYDWQGAQITLICFDELTHFTAHQFFCVVSRNRSTCGVRPYIRATCNSDADSWVSDFLAWWIDPETGFPIPERAGVLRYYVRVGNKIEWADRPEDLMQDLQRAADLPPGFDSPRPISVTFIPARVSDKPALLQVNPEYLSWPVRARRSTWCAPQRLYREPSFGDRRQADAVRAVQFAVPRRQRQDPAGSLERGTVLEGFPDVAHDDEVDACSSALEMLNPPMKSWAAHEIARQDAEAILAAQQRKPQPAPPNPTSGLLEWFVLQEKQKNSS